MNFAVYVDQPKLEAENFCFANNKKFNKSHLKNMFER